MDDVREQIAMLQGQGLPRLLSFLCASLAHVCGDITLWESNFSDATGSVASAVFGPLNGVQCRHRTSPCIATCGKP